jgi:hypothetical protein
MGTIGPWLGLWSVVASPRLAAPWATIDRASGAACDESLVLLGQEGV